MTLNATPAGCGNTVAPAGSGSRWRIRRLVILRGAVHRRRSNHTCRSVGTSISSHRFPLKIHSLMIGKALHDELGDLRSKWAGSGSAPARCGALVALHNLNSLGARGPFQGAVRRGEAAIRLRIC